MRGIAAHGLCVTTELRDALRALPVRSFVRASDLPGPPVDARSALRAEVVAGNLVAVRRDLFYRGVSTRYGMTRPTACEVATNVFGTVGVGPCGYSAARALGVTTQMPAQLHLAVTGRRPPVRGVVVHQRSNRLRDSLTWTEIAVLEVLRNPGTYAEVGWPRLVAAVRQAAADGRVDVDRLARAALGERNAAVRANCILLVADLQPVSGAPTRGLHVPQRF